MKLSPSQNAVVDHFQLTDGVVDVANCRMDLTEFGCRTNDFVGALKQQVSSTQGLRIARYLPHVGLFSVNDNGVLSRHGVSLMQFHHKAEERVVVRMRVHREELLQLKVIPAPVVLLVPAQLFAILAELVAL